MTVPKHVAIIMDGNGRWGLKKKKSRNYGHKQGIITVRKIISESINKKIKFLTLYAFSTENWKRPTYEVNYLLKLLELYIDNELKKNLRNGVRLKILGQIKKFPPKLKTKLKKAERLTKKNNKIQLNLALNYGSRQEILYALKELNKKKIKLSEINISKNLYTRNVPDPEILIRTGNTKRLSNFLLWQSIYSEIFFEKKLWPDFNENDYNKILNKYKKIKRNFGGI